MWPINYIHLQLMLSVSLLSSSSMSKTLTLLLLLLLLDLLEGNLLTEVAFTCMKLGGMIVFTNLLGDMSLR